MTNVLRSIAALTIAALLAACGGGGGGSSSGGGGNVTPTTSPNESAFVCPTSGASPSIAHSSSAQASRSVARRSNSGGAHYVPGMLAVVYDQQRMSAAALPAGRATAVETALGARLVREYRYSKIAQVAHILNVGESATTSAMAKLRSQAGVKSVSRVLRLSRSAVTSPYTPNDPYYKGYPGTGAPYYESASIGGEWDMHAIGLGSAWGYSQSANGSGITNAGALGSSSVRLAVIDTGEDLTSPELGNGKVVRSECFITDENGNQSASTYVTDQDGHGTDVAGIATALVNNGVGFVGTGGKVSLMAYRVFPTPDDNCLNDSSSDDQCSASSTDIASAIDDAVANGANVINLSFGSGTGSSCQDDNVEGPAIANAIANNVIVVAAAGNAGASSVDVPACDPGVIAAGASALADGQTNGSGVGGSGEYVASYSNYASSNATRWGIVAPGGDPYCPNTNGGCTDTDYLHWIYHIYTSTPLDSNYAGLCSPDDGTTAPIDCRILIAGTSMAAPHIAGAAALIVAANPAYQSPSAMFQLLCSTADNIGAAHQGCGRLDVEHAMGVAVGDPSPGTAAVKR